MKKVFSDTASINFNGTRAVTNNEASEPQGSANFGLYRLYAPSYHQSPIYISVTVNNFLITFGRLLQSQECYSLFYLTTSELVFQLLNLSLK